MPWREVFEEKFGSNRTEAARAVHAAWKRAAPREAKDMTVDSLATKVGALIKGRMEWWLKRPMLCGLFARLLGVDVDAVFGAPPRRAGTLAFPEFPQLPPLGTTEEPCRVWGDSWLVHLVLAGLSPHENGERRLRWVTASAGAGKSLAVRYLQARYAERVIATTVGTLEEALVHVNSALPLVVEIEERRPQSDAGALRALAQRRRPAVVLAPFAFPEPTWSGPGALTSRSATGWESIAVRFGPGWRERLLSWIDERRATRGEAKPIRDDVLAWLSSRDPSGIAVGTPGDLLALAADFDAHGLDGATFGRRAERWLRDAGRSALPDDVPSTWRAHNAIPTYVAVVVGHLRGTNEKYGSLTSDAWTALVPRSQSTGAKPDKPGSAVVTGYLRGAGLLRGGPDALVPYPSWVARGVEHDALLRDLEKGAVASWGAIAGDEGRRSVVDGAIDGLSDGALRAVIRDVAKLADPDSLAALAALEAVVAGVGRRLAQPTFRLGDNDIERVQSLVLRQIAALTPERSYGQLHHPFTRRNVGEWLATAWTIGFRVPRPSTFQRGDLAWELPGWCEQLALEDAPRHLFPSSYFAEQPIVDTDHEPMLLTEVDYLGGRARAFAPPHLRRLAELTPLVVPKLKRGPVPHDLPRLLLAALFLSAPATGWDLDVKHLARLHESWDERFLATQAVRLAPGDQAVLAALLWDLSAKEIVADGAVPVAERIEMLRGRHPGLVDFVLERVPVNDVERTARLYGISRRATGTHAYQPSDPLALAHLPRPTRQRALRAWLDGAEARGVKFDEAREIVPLLDGEDLDLALDLIRAASRHVAPEFMSLVWTLAPARAREEARRAIDDELPSAEGWFHLAPRAELGFLVDLVCARPQRPTWAKDWAFRMALEGGAAAERLYTLAAMRWLATGEVRGTSSTLG